MTLQPHLIIDAIDSPAARAMLEAEGQSGAGRVDFEDRPGTDVGSISRSLAPDGGEVSHGQAPLAPGDLAWSAVEPIGSNADIDWLHADDGHRGFLFCFSRRSFARALERQNGRSTCAVRLGEQTFDVKIGVSFAHRPRHCEATACQLA